MAILARNPPFKDISNNAVSLNVSNKQQWHENLKRAGITEEQFENPHFIEFLNNYHGATPKTSITTNSNSCLSMNVLNSKQAESSYLPDTSFASRFSESVKSLADHDFTLQDQINEQEGTVSPTQKNNLEKVLQNYSLFGTLDFDIDRKAWKKKLRSIGHKRREKKMMTEPSSFEFRQQLDQLAKKKKDLVQVYQNVLSNLSQWTESQNEMSLTANSVKMLESLQTLLKNDYEYEVNAAKKWNGFAEWLLSVRIREVSLFVSRCNVQDQNQKVVTSQNEMSSDVDFYMSEYEKAKSSLDIDYAAYNKFLTNTGLMMLCNNCNHFDERLLKMLDCNKIAFDQGFAYLKAEYPDLMNKKLQSCTISNKQLLKSLNKVSKDLVSPVYQNLGENENNHDNKQFSNFGQSSSVSTNYESQTSFSKKQNDAKDNYIDDVERSEMIRKKEIEIEKKELNYIKGMAAKSPLTQTIDSYDYNQGNATYMLNDSPMITDFRKSKIPTPFDKFTATRNKKDEMSLTKIQKERQEHNPFNFSDLNSQILSAPEATDYECKQQRFPSLQSHNTTLEKLAGDNEDELKVDITFNTIDGFENNIQVKDFTDDCKTRTDKRDPHLQDMFDSGNITAVVSAAQDDVYDAGNNSIGAIKSLLPSLNPWSLPKKTSQQVDIHY